MPETSLLSLEEILFIHHQEIQAAGGEPSIRDREGIKACVDAPNPDIGYLQERLPLFSFNKSTTFVGSFCNHNNISSKPTNTTNLL